MNFNNVLFYGLASIDCELNDFKLQITSFCFFINFITVIYLDFVWERTVEEEIWFWPVLFIFEEKAGLYLKLEWEWILQNPSRTELGGSGCSLRMLSFDSPVSINIRVEGKLGRFCFKLGLALGRPCGMNGSSE